MAVPVWRAISTGGGFTDRIGDGVRSADVAELPGDLT